jgi:hypothetical protein
MQAEAGIFKSEHLQKNIKKSCKQHVRVIIYYYILCKQMDREKQNRRKAVTQNYRGRVSGQPVAELHRRERCNSALLFVKNNCPAGGKEAQT